MDKFWQGLPDEIKSTSLYFSKSNFVTSPMCSISGKLYFEIAIAFLSISDA